VNDYVSKRLDLTTTAFRRDVFCERRQQAVPTDSHDDLIHARVSFLILTIVAST
jgi:hypothetical protein